MRKILLAAAISGTLLAAGSANALTTTANFAVTATVVKNCTVSAAALAFGPYTPTVSQLAVNTAVAVKCTKGTTFTVALNGGTTAGGTITQRLMANGANTLQYNLYTDAAFTTLFGDGTTGVTGSGAGNGLGAGAAVNLTVFGRLPDNATNQDAAPGNYTDSITATVTY